MEVRRRRRPHRLLQPADCGHGDQHETSVGGKGQPGRPASWRAPEGGQDQGAASADREGLARRRGREFSCSTTLLQDDWGAGSKKKGKGGKKPQAAKAKPAAKPSSSAKGRAEAPDSSSLFTLDSRELAEVVRNTARVPERLLEELEGELRNEANRLYRESVEASLRAVASTDAQSRRQELDDRKRKITALHEQICVFEQGIELLPGQWARFRDWLQNLCARTSPATCSSPAALSWPS